MCDDFETFVKPNLGANEKWVPYHTVFGVHEWYHIKELHGEIAKDWEPKHRFLATFIFRAHCKRDLFEEVQLPLLKEKDFWRQPLVRFGHGDLMEEALLKYRRNTKKPLQTAAFRAIPPKELLDDRDANLVRSIINRTRSLLMAAEKIWPYITDNEHNATHKFDEMSRVLRSTKGCGPTWTKMLLVSIDLAYPDLGLLVSQCDVGVGAVQPLRALLGTLDNATVEDPKASLIRLTELFNKNKSRASDEFWDALALVERKARSKYKGATLVQKQLRTERGQVGAGTL